MITLPIDTLKQQDTYLGLQVQIWDSQVTSKNHSNWSINS